MSCDVIQMLNEISSGLVPLKLIGSWEIESNFPDNFTIGVWGISSEIALRWMSVNLTEDKLTLIQVLA